ncbi:MAG: O-antigen ligase family protein [Acidobacteria bacterium]|nr:O-antigen ligase family protein [Acidobacteriota bacterium]
MQLKAITPQDVTFFLACGAAVSSLVSTAAFNILTGAALVSLLVTRHPLRFPPFAAPLALLAGWTLLSLALADTPRDGWPQVRKFYIWIALPMAVHSAVRTAAQARGLLLAYLTAATASASWALIQYSRKWSAARASGLSEQDAYVAYVANRITGFMSHWMTFSGEMVAAIAISVAWLMFVRTRRPWIATALVVMAAAQVLSLTRTMWAATAAALLYLIWSWRPRFLLAVPVAAGLVLAAAPGGVTQRVVSLWKPGKKDSNEHRYWLRLTGIRMIAAHPLLGVGPEHVKRNFEAHLPSEAPRPIPKDWYYDHLHNLYIHYAAERGLPAALAIVWLLGVVLRDMWIARGPFEVQAAAGCVIGAIVAGWGEVNLGDSEVLASVLVPICCAYSVIRDA